jgi:hypothetical protein
MPWGRMAPAEISFLTEVPQQLGQAMADSSLPKTRVSNWHSQVSHWYS